MRILYLADIRFPLERANGIQTFETCYALADRGHDVTLLVRPDTLTPPRDPWVFYGMPPHPRLAFVRVPFGLQAARRLRYLCAALAAGRRGRSDVVFTRDLGVASALVRVPRALRAPVVYESHGYAPAVSRALPRLLSNASPPGERKLHRLTRREARVWRQADGYVTITSALAAELSGRFGPRERLAVVPDGVRLGPDRTCPEPSTHGTPIVAYAGHLYPWKGVDVLVDALARMPGVRGLIVGGHPSEPDLTRLKGRAVSQGVADRIEFTGMVPPSDVAAHLQRATVLVLPNVSTPVSERYTSPLKLFEYLAAGKPIVASDLPAIREVVDAGPCACLVAPGDPAALAAGIARVLENGALAGELARQAWTRAAEFSWARRAGRLEHLLTTVRAERG